ncbi:MAG: hypothetical protein AAF211_07695 [Myxococcota bacterium]
MLERVYDAALEADPDNSDTWASFALARANTDANTAAVRAACVAPARRAVALRPDDGHHHGLLGMLLHAAGQLTEAKVVLERSIALGHRGWSHLHLAHALHDLQRFDEAAAAYGNVPIGALPGWAAWRIPLLREQRAACLHRAGRRTEALAAYTEVLERFERALDAGLDARSSPVLSLGRPNYLLDDLEDFPELRARAESVVKRLDEA